MVPTTIHDLVNQTLAQMTPLARPTENSWDFLQQYLLEEIYVCVPVPSNFTQLKLEIYDGSSDPTQHMMSFTS